MQRWNGHFFEKTSLKTLGLRVQIGHPPRETCILPRPAKGDDFVVIDSDGIHEIALDFCGCHRTATSLSQLLRSRLFPATTIDPKTAATFRVLETFQMLSFTAKISAHEFVVSLSRRTDNSNTANVRVSVDVSLKNNNKMGKTTKLTLRTSIATRNS
jgi:hypothetical protein